MDKNADDALRALLDGNQRYVANATTHPDRTQERRAELSRSQEPFATILGCADSRVPAELVFDGALGDLFVVRTAGHVIDEAVLGTIEFGTEELGIPLIFVLGHERCGAVKATISAIEGSDGSTGSTSSLIRAIMPAVDAALDRSGDLWDNAVRANISVSIDRLKDSPVLAAAIERGAIKIAGGLYDLETGLVEVTVG